jgi:hypothetical protein
VPRSRAVAPCQTLLVRARTWLNPPSTTRLLRSVRRGRSMMRWCVSAMEYQHSAKYIPLSGASGTWQRNENAPCERSRSVPAPLSIASVVLLHRR